MQPLRISGIPVCIWGEASERLYLYVHGKLGSKMDAAEFAKLANARGAQVLSFDLPGHGERPSGPCHVCDAVRDLEAIWEFAQRRGQRLSLYANSIGAYFSLMAWANVHFERCLFQSPILDMPRLVERMFTWFGITPEQLEREGEIDTPVDRLSWSYYQYALAHPVQHWPSPTHILYADGDELQSPEVARDFAVRFGCTLTVAENCSHAFDDPNQQMFARRWLTESI